MESRAHSDEALLPALRTAMAIAVDRLNEARERSPCLNEEDADMRVLGKQRRVLLDVLMACWGVGTWLGVNGVFVQLPLLVQRLPELWTLPSWISIVIQLANVGVIIYVVLRRLLPRGPESLYIYVLLVIGTLALFLNGFLYQETAYVAGTERSVSFLAITFFTGFVGCTSSVLFYPYLRHFRDIYLATYLVGEGLSGLLPSIISLIQGTGGEPRCVYGPDNTTVDKIYAEPLFDTTVFMAILGCLSALSLASFALIHNLSTFLPERVKPVEVAKEEEATMGIKSLLQPSWITVMTVMAVLNALMNGVLPSVQSYSCMPYGAETYHFAVTLGAMANPVACLAGVWLKPVRSRVLGGMLAAGLVPLAYLLVTALLSPTPPLYMETSGRALIVVTWVCVYAIISYARMWVYEWARRGGANGMRACGVVTQIGSAVGSLTTYLLIQYTTIFKQAPTCPLPPL